MTWTRHTDKLTSKNKTELKCRTKTKIKDQTETKSIKHANEQKNKIGFKTPHIKT